MERTVSDRSRCRSAAAKLRRNYANKFGVPLEEVIVVELPMGDAIGDEAEVYAPKRPDLPWWTTGVVL